MLRRRKAWPVPVFFLVLAGCSAPQPLTITPQSEKATSPVVREVLPPQPMPATAPDVVPPEPAGGAPTLANAAPSSASTASSSTAAALLLPPQVPAGTLYVCAATVDGQPRHTAIEYVSKVKALCAKHPEMGVCQYEREACRASGGRVFDARGTEITKQTEAEYDKKVMRVRFRAG